jgi:hypothetical protein
MGNCITSHQEEMDSLKHQNVMLYARNVDLKLKNYDLRNENTILRENVDKLMNFIVQNNMQTNSINGNIQRILPIEIGIRGNGTRENPENKEQ